MHGLVSFSCISDCHSSHVDQLCWGQSQTLDHFLGGESSYVTWKSVSVKGKNDNSASNKEKSNLGQFCKTVVRFVCSSPHVLHLVFSVQCRASDYLLCKDWLSDIQMSWFVTKAPAECFEFHVSDDHFEFRQLLGTRLGTELTESTKYSAWDLGLPEITVYTELVIKRTTLNQNNIA